MKRNIAVFLVLFFLCAALPNNVAAAESSQVHKFIKVSSWKTHTLVLRDDGTVWTWGYDNAHQTGQTKHGPVTIPVYVEGITDVVDIAAGSGHSAALKSDGTVWVWGNNYSGELGVETEETQTAVPVQVEGLSDIKAVAAGESYTMALKKDGTLWAFGANIYGNLGDGTSIYRRTPVKLNIENVSSIAASHYYSAAVKRDGTLWVWGTRGRNKYAGDKLQPVQVQGVKGVKKVSLGLFHGTILKEDGTVWQWVIDVSSTNFNDSDETIYLRQVKSLYEVKDIEAGERHTLALKRDGTVWAWGWNKSGELGIGSFTDNTSPQKVKDLSSVTGISAGEAFSVAVKSDGTIWSWGRSYLGQLGNGVPEDVTKRVSLLDSKNYSTPVLVKIDNNAEFPFPEGTIIQNKFSVSENTEVSESVPVSAGNKENVRQEEAEADEANMLYPAYVQENGVRKWGLIDRNGSFVVKPVYDMINDFWDNGLAAVTVKKYVKDYYKSYFGLINRQGELVAEPIYTYHSLPSDGTLILRENDSKNLVIDDTGNILFETPYNIYQFKNGMAKFSVKVNDKEWYNGYLNNKGEEAIPPQYKIAGDFNNGMAPVTTVDNKKVVIDKTGQILYHLNINDAANLSEGIFTFRQTQLVQGKITEKMGYANFDGTILLEAKYVSANPFKDGLAVVATDYTYPGSEGHVGLIDKSGEFVISPDYSDIQPKGQGYFAIGRGGFRFSSPNYSKKALFNSKGEQITDFLFHTIGDLKDGHFPVCDGERVFFIDTNGKEADNYPKAQGIGVFKDMGELVQGKFDNEIVYYSKDGNIVFKPQETWKYKTSQGIEIYEKKYKPDFDTLIYYPEIRNHPESKIQDKLNSELKRIFVEKNKENHEKDLLSLASFSVNFNVSQNKDLLIVNYSSYLYPYGAAHGMPAREYYLFNMYNGNTYKLSDLFKKDSTYLDRLSEIIKVKIQQKKADKNSMILINEFEGFKKDPKFTVTQDALQIYFYPYEIAAYAAGFPTFDIPYAELADMLDFDGEFWNSFEKNYRIVPVPAADNKQNAERAVADLIKAYETNIIEAINKIDFTYVEPVLLSGSSLYKSQKSLVDYLGSLEIKEKLEDYRLYIIDWTESFKQCKVYVYEKTNIRYSEDDSETKEFYWIYTAQYNPSEQKYQLSNMQVWNRE